MLSETEIQQRWVNLFTAHGAQFGPPDNGGRGYGRWGMGYYNEGLTEAGVDEHLQAMFEAIRNTGEEQGFALTEVRAADLEFNEDDASGAQIGAACYYAPTRPVPTEKMCGE